MKIFLTKVFSEAEEAEEDQRQQCPVLCPTCHRTVKYSQQFVLDGWQRWRREVGEGWRWRRELNESETSHVAYVLKQMDRSFLLMNMSFPGKVTF